MVIVERINNKRKYIKCNICGSILSFEAYDVEYLLCGKFIVECPNCKSLVTVKEIISMNEVKDYSKERIEDIEG